MNRVKIGEIAPLCSGDMRGMELSGDFLKMSGLVMTSVHHDNICISDGEIAFTYTVGGKQVVRSFTLERDAVGNVTAFIGPDGVRTEVQRSG